MSVLKELIAVAGKHTTLHLSTKVVQAHKQIYIIKCLTNVSDNCSQSRYTKYRAKSKFIIVLVIDHDHIYA